MNELVRDRRVGFEQTIREFLCEDESPLCPHCGEEVLITMKYPDLQRLQIEIECPQCTPVFRWTQPPATPWNRLHLSYFLERIEQGERPRCPIDDCVVTCAEYSDGTCEFRCAYCNRRGSIQIAAQSLDLKLE